MPVAEAPALEFKTFTGLRVKVVDAAQGIVEAIVAVTGNTDDGGDVIAPGAYQFKRHPKVVWSHDLTRLIAKVLEYRELKANDAKLPAKLKNLGGLWFRMQFDLEDPESFSAFRKVVFHEDIGWSIGYETPAGGAKKLEDGRRLLKTIYVWEASPAAFGMNEGAMTVSVKSILGKAIKDLGIGEEKEAAVADIVSKFIGEGGETKAWPPLAGSFEDTAERCRTAVEAYAVDQLGERGDDNWWYVSIDGTFSDTVVATIRRQGENQTFRFPYTVGDDGTVELGEAEEVEVQTVVAPASGTPADTGGDDAVTDLEEDAVAAVGEKMADALKAVDEAKAGRVLSAANAQRLRAAAEALATVLAAATSTDDDEDDEDDKGGKKVLARRLVGKGQGGEVEAPVQRKGMSDAEWLEMQALADDDTALYRV